MKKILTVLLTATLVLSFAGCWGGSDVKEDNETATSVTEKATEPKTEEPTEKEKEATVQEKIEDYIIDNSDQFSAVKEQFKDVMDLDVSADDKTLIVQYTYLQDVGDAIDTDTIDETSVSTVPLEKISEFETSPYLKIFIIFSSYLQIFYLKW